MNRPGYNPDERVAPGMGPAMPPPQMEGETLKLTPEEERTLKQCESESFRYRSLPLMLFAGIGTPAAVKAGHLKPHPALGAVPKTMCAVVAAYLVGRISYVPTCLEMLKSLPPSTSPLSRKLRAKSGAHFTEEYHNDRPQPLKHFARSDVTTPQGQEYASNFESAHPDDSPSDDIPQAGYQNAQGIEPGRKRSFEELRNENRLQYAQSLYSRPPPNPPQASRVQDFGMENTLPPELRSDPSPPPAPAHAVPRRYPQASTQSQKPVRRNAYGDPIED